MIKQEIGKRITSIRVGMHMTKEEFGKHLGVTGQYLGTVERGRCCLSVEKLKKLCEFSNLSADYILFGKDSKIENLKLKALSPEQFELGKSTLLELVSFLRSII